MGFRHSFKGPWHDCSCSIVLTTPALLVAFAALLAALANAATDRAELQAVYDIMAATGNAWAAAIPDVCQNRWHGIECTADSHGVSHVTSLSLGTLSEDTAFPACTPSAYISPSIARLSHLRHLFFFQCCAASRTPLPAALAALGPTLQTLVLRQNGHIGDLPEALLYNLTELRTLDLHGNHLTGRIPPLLGIHVKRLELLDFSSNNFDGNLPPSLDALTALRILDVSSNSLDGTLDNVRLLPDLQKLDVHSNLLYGSLSLYSLPSLLFLDLSNNRFSGNLPSSFSHLSRLHTLIVQNCSLASTFPTSLTSLSHLQVLVLSNSQVLGPLPDIFLSLPRLRILHLDGNRLNGSIPSSLGKLPHISELKLDGNLLTGPLPFSREFVWRLGRRLRLSRNSGLCLDRLPGDSGSLMSVEQGSPLQGIEFCGLNSTTREPAAPSGHELRGSATASNNKPMFDTSGGHVLSISLLNSLIWAILLILYALWKACEHDFA